MSIVHVGIVTITVESIYNADTLRNKKRVLIIEVYAFQGDIYIARIGLMLGTCKRVHIIEVSVFQGCLRGGVPLGWYNCSDISVLLPCLSTSVSLVQQDMLLVHL